MEGEGLGYQPLGLCVCPCSNLIGLVVEECHSPALVCITHAVSLSAEGLDKQTLHQYKTHTYYIDTVNTTQ